MRHTAIVATCFIGLASAVGATAAAAQIRGSEAAVLAQTVDGTKMTVEYSRPAARGRELFGSLVPWNVAWTGANWATTFETSRSVRLNGIEVPEGRYSVWIVPRQEGRWTVFLDPDVKLFHFQKPDSAADQIHIPVKPETGPHTELLTWAFPAVSGDGAVLRMQWGTTTVPLQVVVQPTKPVVLAAEDRAPYLGSYDMKMLPGVGWPETGRFEVFEEDGMLRGRLPFPIHPGDELTFDLVPAGQHRFSPGIYRDGKLFNVEPGGTFEFDVKGGDASAVRLRGVEGTVFGEGVRTSGDS